MSNPARSVAESDVQVVVLHGLADRSDVELVAPVGEK
jgi:hypothetical protein